MKKNQKDQNGTRSTDMRFSNKLLLLNLLRKQQVSRAELARQMGLTRAGVTMLVDELLQSGILQEVGTNRAEMGRRPMMLRVKADCFYAVGISLTRRDCNIGLLNLEGQLVKKQSLDLPKEGSASELIEIICNRVQDMVAESGIPENRILGVGMSTPGPLDVANGVILNSDRFQKWSNFPIVAEVEQRLPWPGFLENTSVARTILEKNYGAGAAYSNFIYIKVADVIGGGVVIGNTLHTGVGKFGNEIGHMSIDLNGETCACGNVGCLSLYATIPALLARYSAPGFENWKQVIDAAYLGDRDALHIVQVESHYLGVAITSLSNLLEPEAFILAGDIDYRPELLLSLIREKVNSSRMLREMHGLDILGAQITENAELLGAAAIIIEKFYQGEFEL